MFDVLNSREFTDFVFQKALCQANYNELKIFIDKSINYIKGLKQLDKEGKPGKTLITSERKTGFLGMMACLSNIQIIHERFISSDMLPLFKLNQDHIELYFGAIRASLGYNNNPSVRQFISAYKKLLVRCQIRDNEIGNCVSLENMDIVHTQIIVLINLEW